MHVGQKRSIKSLQHAWGQRGHSQHINIVLLQYLDYSRTGVWDYVPQSLGGDAFRELEVLQASPCCQVAQHSN